MIGAAGFGVGGPSPSWMLARQAALDDLGDGRTVLGIGTGWIEREHSLFGADR